MQALDRWEERLEALFDGKPYDELDAALTDTISRFPLHIQPFRDMIEGMRMDLVKSRYETFDELYEYCYRVAGTVALMTTPIMGIEPSYKVCGLCGGKGWTVRLGPTSGQPSLTHGVGHLATSTKSKSVVMLARIIPKTPKHQIIGILTETGFEFLNDFLSNSVSKGHACTPAWDMC